MKSKLDEALIQRILSGEDPAALAREASDPAAVAEAMRAVEWVSLATEPVAPRGDLRDAILSATAPEPRFPGFEKRIASLFQIDPEEARSLLASTDRVDEEPWFDDRVAGVRMRRVEAGAAVAGATCLLVHLEPGVAYPTHRHLGDEWCLFLQGTAREGDREWNPGDLVLNPSGSQHPVLEAVSNEPFIFAVVFHEGIEFTDG